jgi:hypothetical protein
MEVNYQCKKFITFATGELTAGYLYCSFVRNAGTQFETPTDPAKQVDFDLNTAAYHLVSML